MIQFMSQNEDDSINPLVEDLEFETIDDQYIIVQDHVNDNINSLLHMQQALEGIELIILTIDMLDADENYDEDLTDIFADCLMLQTRINEIIESLSVTDDSDTSDDE